MNTDIENLFKDKVIRTSSWIVCYFFTEMWERFSFYGMRILLVLFFTAASLIGDNPGWEWPRENAMAINWNLCFLLYLTPILGGILADKLSGYRWAVIIGVIIMTVRAC